MQQSAGGDKAHAHVQAAVVLGCLTGSLSRGMNDPSGFRSSLPSCPPSANVLHHSLGTCMCPPFPRMRSGWAAIPLTSAGHQQILHCSNAISHKPKARLAYMLNCHPLPTASGKELVGPPVAWQHRVPRRPSQSKASGRNPHPKILPRLLSPCSSTLVASIEATSWPLPPSPFPDPRPPLPPAALNRPSVLPAQGSGGPP